MKSHKVIVAAIVSAVALAMGVVRYVVPSTLERREEPSAEISSASQAVQSGGETGSGIESEEEKPVNRNTADPRRYNETYDAIQHMPDEMSMDRSSLKRMSISGVSGSQWECMGPQTVHPHPSSQVYMHGRIRSFEWYLRPSDGEWEPYAGASSGGLWQGEISGGSVTWTSLGDNLPNPAVGAFVVHPTDRNTIFVGTGDWGRYNGAGLFKTTNRGQTWTRVQLTASDYQPSYITGIFYLVSGLTMMLSSSDGAFRSTDGGSTWSHIPIDSSDSFAKVYNLVAVSAGTLYATLPRHGIYKSITGGMTWTKLVTGLPTTDLGSTIALDACASSPEILFASYVDKDDNSKGIYGSTDGGATWTQKPSAPAHIMMSQGFHTNVIRVHPLNPSVVYAGGVKFIRTLDGGTSWTEIGGEQIGHSDIQVIAFHPDDANHMYICSDGGIFERNESANIGWNWNHRFVPGAPIQEYALEYAMSEPSFMVSGTQDNGTLITHDASNSLSEWSMISGCDGGNNITIDPDNADVFFYNSWCGASHPRYRTTNRGKTIDYISNGLEEFWYSPIRYNKGGGSYLWTLTTSNLYYSSNRGTTWLRAALGSGSDFTYSSIRLDVNWWSDNSVKVAYVTMLNDPATPANEQSKLRVAEGVPGLMTWRIATLPSQAPIAAIIPDRWYKDKVFATEDGQSVTNIYMSTNRGISWTNIGGNLPDGLVVSDLVVSELNEKAMYAATSMGVFKTLNGGKNWFKFQTGLPVVPVISLAYVPGLISDTLRIGTFGRGYWQRLIKDLNPQSAPAPNIPGTYYSSSLIPFKGIIVGDSGSVGQTTDNGKTWSKINVSTVRALRRVKIVDPVSVVTIGDGGAMFRSSDGGGSWNPIVGLTAEDFTDMSFAGASSGWSTTKQGKVFATTSGGVDWSLLHDFAPQELTSCFFLDEQTGWSTGTISDPAGTGTLMGMINKTTDGGTTWSANSLPIVRVNRLQFVDPATGFAVGDSGNIVKTTDGGANWEKLASGTTENLMDCFFTDAGNGRACGTNGLLLKTENGGVDWSDAESGTTMTLFSISFSGNAFFYVGENIVLASEEVNQNITYYDLNDRWNLVALSVQPSDTQKSSLFPTSSSNAFEYTGGYSNVQNLRAGRGYWLRFTGSQVVTVAGAPLEMTEIDVSPGWNLIGAPGFTVPAQKIGSVPAGILSTPFFGYTNRYEIASNLIPGRGYWVKAGQAGKIVFTPGSPASASGPGAPAIVSQLNEILFTDRHGNSQSLHVSATESDMIEMPPPPPAGGFDVRFASGEFVESPHNAGKREIPVIIGGAEFPVDVTWKSRESGLEWTLVVDGIETILTGSGAISLKAAPRQILISFRTQEERDIPARFVLHQNYPNPFNPSTAIRYEIAHEKLVSLRAYDVLGREVATLVNEVLQPGVYTSTWNAGHNASGIYFVRLFVGDPLNPATMELVETRKLVLIR